MNYDKMWIFNTLVPVACYFHFSQAVKSSCMAPPVKLGDEATLSCRFDLDISKFHRDVFVYLYKDNTEHPVVTYAWHGEQAKIHTVQGYRIEGDISDHLAVKITNVSNSNAGQYRCIVALSIDTHELCTLKFIDVHSSESMTSIIVTEKTASQAHDIFTEQHDAENTLYIVTVVLGAVLGVMVVIFLTILIIAVYKRWISMRCCTRDVNSDKESVDNNKPKTYIYNPPSKDTKKIKIYVSQQQGLLA